VEKRVGLFFNPEWNTRRHQLPPHHFVATHALTADPPPTPACGPWTWGVLLQGAEGVSELEILPAELRGTLRRPSKGPPLRRIGGVRHVHPRPWPCFGGAGGGSKKNTRKIRQINKYNVIFAAHSRAVGNDFGQKKWNRSQGHGQLYTTAVWRYFSSMAFGSGGSDTGGLYLSQVEEGAGCRARHTPPDQ